MKFTHKILAFSLLMVSGFAFASQPQLANSLAGKPSRAKFISTAKERFASAQDQFKVQEIFNELEVTISVSAAPNEAKESLSNTIKEMANQASERTYALANPIKAKLANMGRIANEKKAKAKEFYAKHPAAVNSTAIAGGVAATGAGLVAAYKKSPKVKENVDAAAKYTKEKAVIASDWAVKKAAAAKAAVVAKFEQLENTPISRANAIIATGTVALGVGAYKCLPSLATTQSAARTSYGYAENHAKNAGAWMKKQGVAVSENDRVVAVVEHVNKHKIAYGSAVGVATASALGYAAYRYYTAPKKVTVVVPVTKVQVIDEEEVIEVVPNY